MVAIIYSRGYVVGYNTTPNIEEFETLGTHYDLIDELPSVISETPKDYAVKRIGPGEYELEKLPEKPPELVDRITQLEQDQLAVKLAVAELASVSEQDKLDIQLALDELTGGE